MGSLNDGSEINRTTPVRLDSDVALVAAGVGYSFFVRTDGSPLGWGSNGDGELGVGTTEVHQTPIQVDTDIIAVDAGRSSSAYVRADGSLWTMGKNFSGQLGDGTTVDRSTPVRVSDGVTDVSMGVDHMLFITEDTVDEPLFVGTPVEGLEGWFFSDWYGFYNPLFSPWVFHAQHGWQYVFLTEVEGEYYIYDLECNDVLWTTPTLYPTFYSFGRGTFNFYFRDTINPRSFVDLETEDFWSKP